MGQNLSGARSVLNQAVTAIAQAQGQINAVADGDVEKAKELVRMVFAAGFKIDGLSQTIGQLETLQNELHQLRAKAAGIAEKIKGIAG